MTTQAEQDKEVAKLYLARSEGKVIQCLTDSGKWIDKMFSQPLMFGNRIKPQTVEDAATEVTSSHFFSLKTGAKYHKQGFVLGAKWQKEQE